jgi:hypothetical protein
VGLVRSRTYPSDHRLRELARSSGIFGRPAPSYVPAFGRCNFGYTNARPRPGA